MSPDERQLLADLFDRVGKAASQPRDRDAEAFIADRVRDQPYAPYLLAQSVIVQDQALRAATDRLQQLEAQVRDLQARAAQAPTGQGQPQSGGFLSGLGSLFGGASPQSGQASARPQMQGGFAQGGAPQGGAPQGGAPQGSPWGAPAPQQMQAAPQQFQPAAPAAGGGFLRGAMGTAAGVAGGVLAANAISGLLHGGSGGGLFGGGQHSAAATGAGDTTIVNNYYNDDSAPDRHDASGDQYGGYDDSYSSDAGFDPGDSGSDNSYDV